MPEAHGRRAPLARISRSGTNQSVDQEECLYVHPLLPDYALLVSIDHHEQSILVFSAKEANSSQPRPEQDHSALVTGDQLHAHFGHADRWSHFATLEMMGRPHPSATTEPKAPRSPHHKFEDERADPLIPTTEAIRSTWRQAEATWTAHLNRSTEWPVGFFNPSVLLAAVPAFPDVVPENRLDGHPSWWMSSPYGGSQTLQGRSVQFFLSMSEPIKVTFKSPSQPTVDSRGEQSNGLTLLILCWSYIMSASLIERQGHQIMYTDAYTPPLISTPEVGYRNAVVLPAPASNRLIRWISCLLSTEEGWVVQGSKSRPRWALRCSTSPQILVSEAPAVDGINAPTSKEAFCLMEELCTLCKLDRQPTKTAIPAVEAAFMAVLALPYYDSSGFDVNLPSPSLNVTTEESDSYNNYKHISRVTEYFKYIPYFMTLSLHRNFYESMLWTMFWQPGIPCNLVSPWFGGTRSALRPQVESGDIHQILRAFAVRRPRVALLWVGVLLLGNDRALQRVTAYLEGYKKDKEYFYCPPELLLGAWTGSVQSFWDYELDGFGNYIGPQQLSQKGRKKSTKLTEGYHHRSEILQRRAAKRITENVNPLSVWEIPFGPIHRSQIEPELCFDEPYFRRYQFWQWVCSTGLDRGFRRKHGTFVTRSLEDNFTTIIPGMNSHVDGDQDEQWRRPNPPGIERDPSEYATVVTVTDYMVDVEGCTSYERLACPGLSNGHPWFRFGRR